MPDPSPIPWPTKVASLALPTREAHVVALVWPKPEGTLLFLAELNLAQPVRQEFTLSLTQTLERAWNNLGGGTADAESTLEQVLVQVNPVLKAHERLLGNPLAPRYHLALALLQQPALALSHLGHLGALVLQDNQATNILGQGSRRPATPTFEHLVGGNLEPGETLVLTTTSLFDYVSLEKLTGLLKLHSPGLALREVEQAITALEHHPAVGLIALRLGEATEQNLGTDSSIQRLLATQATTSSLLKPTVWSWLKQRTNPLRRRQDRAVAESAAPSLEPRPRVEEVYLQRAKRAHPLTRGWQGLTRIVAKLSWLRSRESAKATIAWWLEGKLTIWRSLPTVKKVLLALALMVLTAFSQSIVTLGRGHLQAQSSERYNQLVTAITENQAAMEGALIYHDDAKAQELLQSTTTLLASLPRNTRSREQQYQALSASLTQVEHRLSRSVEVTDLAPWLALPGLTAGNTWRTSTLIGGHVVATASSGETAFVSPDAKVTTGAKLPAELGAPNQAIALDSALLLTGQNGKQAVVDAKSTSVQMVPTPVVLTDGAWYQGRLYYLGTKPSTIFRTTRTGNSFSPPTRWLRTSQGELSQATSLTIDGAIYVSDGSSIQKFVQGLKRDFTVQPTTPPLQHVQTIHTTSDTDYLYLLAPADKRLVVFDKQGKLVVQLIFPTLSTITDFTVDGQSKYLYLLSGTSLYRLKLTNYTAS